MSKVVIEIETDNDAFRFENGELDLMATVLVIDQARDKLAAAAMMNGFRNLHDYNGNTCGIIKIEED